MATVAPGDFVQVKLTSLPSTSRKNYIDLGWNNKYYRAELGKTVAVPFEAVANHFGDPRSAGSAQAVRYGGPESAPSYVPTRESEVARLRLRYGILTGAEGTFLDADDNVLVPQVTVTTLSGDPITTVIDDPEGNSVNSATLTISGAETQQALIARMQEQISFLQQQVSNMGGTESNPSSIPVDSGFVDEPPHDET